jgi:hypothetical protein
MVENELAADAATPSAVDLPPAVGDLPVGSAPQLTRDGAGSNTCPLDRRVIGLWQLSNAIGFGVMLLILLVFVLYAGLKIRGTLQWQLLGWAVVGLTCMTLGLWYPHAAYGRWGYRIDHRVLETHHGVVFRVSQLLPLSRLQHVDLHRGPLERSFGLASLVLHTAGTHHAVITIPGLDADEAARLRDLLVEVGGDDAV